MTRENVLIFMGDDKIPLQVNIYILHFIAIKNISVGSRDLKFSLVLTLK